MAHLMGISKSVCKAGGEDALGYASSGKVAFQWEEYVSNALQSLMQDASE